MTYEARYKTKISPNTEKVYVKIIPGNPQINFVGDACSTFNKYKNINGLCGKYTIKQIGRILPLVGILLTMVGIFSGIYFYTVRRNLTEKK